MNEPLIEIHGNKGSIDDDPPAAMRYTETRLSKITKELLNGIKKNTVIFSPNFDDSEKEPTVLPALMPNLLINGSKGIASGYATEMPPHNLGEIIDAIIFKIQSPNAKLSTLMQFVKGPDFPTGGEIQGKEGIKNAFLYGQGKIIIRSKYKINDSKINPYIEILEIPYGVVKSKLVRKIDEKRFNNLISGIKNVRDETDRNGVSIKIELNSNVKIKPILNYLLSKTDMQIYYNYNNIVIVDKMPKLLSLSKLIDAYIKHQKEVQKSLIKYDLIKNKNRLEIIDGLIKISKNIEVIIDIIKNVKGSKQGVVKNLIDKFNFSKIQANAIAELKLYRLSKTDQNIYFEEKKELQEKIEYSNKLLNDEKKINNYLILLLKNLKKKFASKRKTKITNKIEKLEINMKNLIQQKYV
jgi:topoisomerase-4 subunit A